MIVLKRGIGDIIWASGSGRGEVCGSREKFSGGEEGAERGIRLLRACGPSELGPVASGSATQGLWLENKKVGSQIIGEDRCPIPGRRTVGKVWRGRTIYRTKEIRDWFRSMYEYVAWHAWTFALVTTDKVCRKAEMYVWRSSSLLWAAALPLSLIVSSISGDHQAWDRRLTRPKGMENVAVFNAREAQRTAVEEREYSSAEVQ